MTVTDYSGLSKVAPCKQLLEPMDKHSGRNSYGRITVRHRGGGVRRKYRVIDFKRNKLDMDAKVLTIEYDPNRSSFIALVEYEDGEKRYIIAPEGLQVGETVRSGDTADIKPGNALRLAVIPVGTFIHNLELYPGKGAQLVRSAGAAAELVAKDGKLCQVRMPSGEVRFISEDCLAVVGQVSNIDHMNESSGSAGRSRWLGKRPSVRGVVMNPVDHPLGGGEGRTSGGRHPCSPWGKNSKGAKTRNNKRTDKYIVRRRQKRA